MTETSRSPKGETLAVAIMAGVLFVFAGIAFAASLLAQSFPFVETMLLGGAMIFAVTGGFAVLIGAWRYLILRVNRGEAA